MKMTLPAFLAWTVLLISACRKDPENTQPVKLEIDRSEFSLLGLVNVEESLNITSDIGWTIEVPSDVNWLSVEPKSGSGNATIKFKSTKENKTNPVKATIKLKGEGTSKDIAITHQPFYTSKKFVAQGGSGEDIISDMVAMPNGGYFAVGSTKSNDNSFIGNTDPNNGNGVLIRFDANGEVQDKKFFGGSDADRLSAIAAAPDGKMFYIVGVTRSTDGEFGARNAGTDVMVLKVNDQGERQWMKFLGTSGNDAPGDICVSKDGLVYVSGSSTIIDGDLSNGKGEADNWIICLDKDGGKKWSNCYGGSENDNGVAALTASSDNNLILASTTSSEDKDLAGTGTRQGHTDAWLCKVNAANGAVIWSKTFNGENMDEFTTITATDDGGCVVSGHTDGPVFNGKEVKDDGGAMVMKVNSNGAQVWTSIIDFGKNEYGLSIAPFQKHGYAVAGYYGEFTQSDGFAALIGNDGNIIWSKILGGSKFDYCYGLCTTTDNYLIAAGHSDSPDWDMKPLIGSVDMFFHKFK